MSAGKCIGPVRIVSSSDVATALRSLTAVGSHHLTLGVTSWTRRCLLSMFERCIRDLGSTMLLGLIEYSSRPTCGGN